VLRNYRRSIRPLSLRVLALTGFAIVFAGLVGPRDAMAAITRVGTALLVGSGAIGQIHPDIAYDDKHSAYLVVWGDGGGGSNRPAYAQLVSRDGGTIGAKLNLTSCPAGTPEIYGQWPRVAYSSGTNDDVFLVVYKQICGKTAQQFAQLLRYSASGIVNLGRVVIRNTGNTGQVVYNPQRGEFLAVWDEVATATGYDGYYRVITLARNSSDVTGVGALPPAKPIALVPNAQGVPAVAYDPNSQSYFITIQGSDPAAPAATAKNVLLARTLDANTGLMSPIIYVEKGGYPVEASVVYLPDSNQFEVFYRQTHGTDPGDVFARRYAPLAGTAIGTSIPALVRPGATGATGAGYDASSHSALVAAMADDYYVWASQISASGDPVTTFRASTAVPTPPGGGTFFPRTVGTGSGLFGMIYGLNYKTVYLDRFSADGSAQPPPPPPPPGSQPLMALGTPSTGSTVVMPLAISGWAVDRGAASGSGVDAVHLYAYPNPGSGQPAVFLGAANYGLSRADVANVLDDSQFVNSGFLLSIDGLEAGTYQIVAFAHSTVANAFNQAKAATVTVKGTRMSLDSPVNHTTAPAPLFVSGWAADNSGSSGTGVDAVHVYAYPDPGSNTPAIFLGVAAYGLVRSDVAGLLGSARFQNSGFLLSVSNLTAGSYRLVAYAHSSVRNAFTAVRTADVTITAGPQLAVDTPTNNASVPASFAVNGWAIDLTAPSGTGVNAVHVWAYPVLGGSPLFVGAAQLGITRADVANAFGARALSSGFTVPATLPLPKGSWVLHIFARSTATGTFNNVATRLVTVP